VGIDVIKGSVIPGSANEAFEVDGLAGATLTSRGVGNMLKYWMGVEGYEKYLKKIQTNGV